MRTINLLIDLSGTLHIGDSATPRAVAALTKLRAAVKERNEVRRGSTELRFCSELIWWY